MSNVTHEKEEITALLVIDPYNDFISEAGKMWDRVSGFAEANHYVALMTQVLHTGRKAAHPAARPGRVRASTR